MGNEDHLDLFIELPFWLFIEDTSLDTTVNGCTFHVDIRDDYVEYFFGEIQDSRRTLIYLGPRELPDDEARSNIERLGKSALSRHCKSVLRIHTRCNADVLRSYWEDDAYRNEAELYLRAFCEAHVLVVKSIVQSYRFATQDEFAHELSDWDLPVWIITTTRGFIRIVLTGYKELDDNPVQPILPRSIAVSTVASPNELLARMSAVPGPGENEVLDALNSFARGDYTEAIRRVLTAIEVVTEVRLREQLLLKWPRSEVERKLEASEIDFPGRLRQLERLIRKKLGKSRWAELEVMRLLRFEIVHRGKQLDFSMRDDTHQMLDHGLRIFEWIEDDPQKCALRANRLDMRSLYRSRPLYTSEITSSGVKVSRRTH